jgi:hypothetical protein
MAQIMSGDPAVFADTYCWAAACPQCGYTELVAENPGSLLESPPSLLSRIQDLLPDP